MTTTANQSEVQFDFNNWRMPRDLRTYFLRFFNDHDLVHYAMTSKQSREHANPALQARAKAYFERNWDLKYGVRRYAEINPAVDYVKLYDRLNKGSMIFRFKFHELTEEHWLIAALLEDEKTCRSLLGDELTEREDSKTKISVLDILFFTGQFERINRWLADKTMTAEDITDFKFNVLRMLAQAGRVDFQQHLDIKIDMTPEDHVDFCACLLYGGHIEKYKQYIKQYPIDKEELKKQYPKLHIEVAADNKWNVSDYVIKEFGFDPYLRAHGESNLLYAAARTGNLKRYKYLLKKQPELLRLSDKNWNTPWHLAAMYGHESIIDLFKPTDYQETNSYSYGLLQTLIACLQNHLLHKYAKQFDDLKAVKGSHLLLTCAKYNNVEAFDLLKEHFGSDEEILATKDKLGRNVVALGVHWGNLSFTKHMIEVFGAGCLISAEGDDYLQMLLDDDESDLSSEMRQEFVDEIRKVVPDLNLKAPGLR